MSKQNWIEIYKFHVFYVTFVAIKLSSLFQYFSNYNTSCLYDCLWRGAKLIDCLWREILPRSSLLTMHKTFIRSQLDSANIIYDQAYNSAFHDKLESVQYKACLAITGAIRATSTEKIYEELGLEPLKSRRWFRKLLLEN